MTTLAPVALLALAMLGCAGGARRTGPTSSLDLSGSRPAPVVQRLRVVALADEAYRRLPAFADRIGDRVDAVSDHLAALFGLPLELMRVEAWGPQRPVRDLEGMLAAVEEATDPVAPDADLVVVFSAHPPPAGARLADLVRSRYAGRFVAVRSLTTLFADAGDDALHRAEMLALLHGLGTVFGALPSCGAHIMADRPVFRFADVDAARAGWADLNLALVRAHATLDLRAGAGRPRVPSDMARRAAALIAPGAPGLPACAADAVAERRALLASIGAASPGSEGADTEADDLDRGLEALADGRDAEALAHCGPAAEVDPASVAARCAGLAAERMGRADDASRYLRAWLLHHADDREATLALARLVGRAGDDDAARALLQRWVAVHADDAEAWLNLGVAYARLGDYADARRSWETVLRLAPGHADARALLDRLPRAAPSRSPRGPGSTDLVRP